MAKNKDSEEKTTAAASKGDTENTEQGKDANTAKIEEKDSAAEGAKVADELITIVVSHKTKNETYRRAGLVLRKKAREEQVTQDQYEKLKKDIWVEVKKK